jgi:hypothetical protein
VLVKNITAKKETMLGKYIIVEKPEYVFTLIKKDLSIIEKPHGTLLEKH